MSGRALKKSFVTKPTNSISLSVREELQTLYKSLQTKNNELIEMENKIMERDKTITDLRKVNEAKEKPFSSKIETERTSKKNVIRSDRSDSSPSVAQTEHLEAIEELNEKIIRQSCHLSYLQRSLEAKEQQITELQNEIDKFRHIVRPITQRIYSRGKCEKCECIDEWNDCIGGIGDWSPGVESTRILPVTEPRIKRQAISAEPLSSLVELDGDDGLIRIPKSSL